MSQKSSDFVPHSSLGIDYPILYEDDHVLAIEKHPFTHYGPIAEPGSIAAFALRHFPKMSEIRDSKENVNQTDPGMIGRLDFETSGISLFAKNQNTFGAIKSEWKAPNTYKVYDAIVIGESRLHLKLPAIFDWPIGHSAKSSKRMLCSKNTENKIFKRQIRGEARSAKTEILNINPLKEKAGEYIYHFKVRIFTGVRHQIRVHLMTIGFPILGDPLYCKAKTKSNMNSQRMWLHHSYLKFQLPNRLILNSTDPGKSKNNDEHNRLFEIECPLNLQALNLED